MLVFIPKTTHMTDKFFSGEQPSLETPTLHCTPLKMEMLKLLLVHFMTVVRNLMARNALK